MTPKHFYLLLLAVIAIQNTTAQNEDELQIPVENDNQFPPDNHSDIIEGSGEGVIEEPAVFTAEVTQLPPIEQIETKLLLDGDEGTQDEEDICPKPCVCRIEGAENDFVIDCSGYDLTEFPSNLNGNATILNIQKNKITEIPKFISNLKKLKILKANDNSIAAVVPGSISELPELVTLDLGNNRLIEFPNDLKNSFGLMKLQVLDLGGNDMRTTLSADMFSKFESLETLILPSSTPDLQQDLCKVLTKSLKLVCTESCEQETFDCEEEAGVDDLPSLPALLVPNDDDMDNDPIIETQMNKETDQSNPLPETSSTSNIKDLSPKNSEATTTGAIFSRTALNKLPTAVAPSNSLVEKPEEAPSTKEGTNIGVSTTDTKTGGVNKTIIGLVVVGMVVIVAVITIKQNWSSIRKRFASNSNNRTPTQHIGGNANGTTPEEVPLQDKSPV